MVEVILVKETLSERQIAAGERVLARLESAGVSVTAAYWVYTQERNAWRLNIVSTDVDRRGDLAVHKTLHQTYQVGEPYLDLQVIGVKDRFFKKLLEDIRTQRPLSNVSLSTLVVGDDLVDLYIYRLPVTVSSVSKKGPNHA